MKCKNCGSISYKSLICPSCGKRLGFSLKTKIYFVIVSFFILSIPMFITNTQRASKPDISERPSIFVGHEYQTRDYAFLALNKEIDDSLTKLSVAKDTIGINMLVSQGLVLLIPPETKILAIDISMFSDKTEVRILDGPHFGASGFMSQVFLK